MTTEAAQKVTKIIASYKLWCNPDFQEHIVPWLSQRSLWRQNPINTSMIESGKEINTAAYKGKENIATVHIP